MDVNVSFPGSELGKVIFFCIVQLLLCFILLGILPSFVLLIGYFLMRRDRSIEIYHKCVFIVDIYMIVLLLLVIFVCVVDPSINSSIGFICVGIAVGVYLAYMFFLDYFLSKPMEVYIKTLISSKDKNVDTKLPLKVLKKENNNVYSVADELLKWKELKKNGIISEDEFLEIKNKLLKDD